MPAGLVRFVLLLRLFGLSEIDTLRLLPWLFAKFPFLSRPGSDDTDRFFLTNRVRSDGGGSQVLYAFFTLAIADWLKMPYRHRPFQRIEHHTGEEDEFLHKWNRVFDFSKRFGTPGDFPVFSLGSRFQVLRALTSRSCGVGITSHRFRGISDQHPKILERARAVLREIYFPYEETIPFSSDSQGIWFHLRRGDVTPQSHPGRFTTIDSLVEDADVVSAALGLEHAPRIVVGKLESRESDSLAKKGFSTVLDGDAFRDLHHLAQAPVLVTGVSSFSYLAGLLNQSTVVFRDFWHPAMRDWISLSAVYDTHEFEEKPAPTECRER
jgi:hypothetical protein